MREKFMCQNEVAKKKLAKSAIVSDLNNSLVKKYNPKTVNIPNTAARVRGTHGSFPNIAKNGAIILIHNPSLPLFSG
jgi:hypothetical protein